MTLETIRLVAAALSDAEHGVNAQLENIPTNGDPAPPEVVIYDETTDAATALNRPAATSPCLQVVIEEPLQIEGEVRTTYRDATVQVGVHYVGRENISANGNAHVHRTNKAIIRAIREWLRNDNAPDREMDGVHVLSCESMLQGTVAQMVNDADAHMFGGIVLTLRVRDNNP